MATWIPESASPSAPSRSAGLAAIGGAAGRAERRVPARHRRPRSRSAQPHPLRRQAVAPGRRPVGRVRDRRRWRARPRVRLPRRHRGSRHRPGAGRVLRLSGDPARARHRRRARSRSTERHHRDRRRLHADLRSGRPWAGARTEGARLRRGRARDRRDANAHRPTPHRAQPPVDAHRPGQPRAVVGRAHGRRAVVPRPLGATAGAVVGRDAQRRPAVPGVRHAPRGVPGTRDHGRGPRLQPARRRPARRARSAAAMRLVAAKPLHVGALAALMAASPLLRRYGVTLRGARASLNDALRNRDTIVVALDGANALGLAWVVATRALDRSAYLRLLLVAEGRQSRGLGALLLADAERRARAAGSRHMVLLVTATNRRARSFYVRQGYRYVGVLPGFARPRFGEALYVKSWPTTRPSRAAR